MLPEYRYYASDSNDNNNDSSNSGNADSETILDIISAHPDSKPDSVNNSGSGSSSSGSNSNFTKESGELIMRALTRASDRQQSSSRQSSYLTASSGRALFGEPQTCSHNLHIHASMNNTILTLTDSRGDPITTQSAGSAGFKKSARAGPEAGYQAMTKLIEKVEEKNVHIQTLHVLMKGFGPGRDSAFKAIRALTTWDIKRISDTTPIPFNGCRPPKPRRL
ncbi:hypothetical protein BGX21_006074 [Mortierella sp. AD011]|nr:hypothetical protein BGX20_010472 [Mortierella sp. AD010]KAF9399548.1 hypothetical protein BGX21_006074 [Mortierella sp. AD011]